MYQETSLKTDRMIYANTRSDEADMDYRMHCHNSYEIYYIITGNVEYLLEGRDCRPRPGTLIIIAPDCFHGLKVLDGQVYHRIRLHFTMEVLDERERVLLEPFRGGVLTSSLGWSGISGRWSSAGNTGKSCKILQFAQASPHF